MQCCIGGDQVQCVSVNDQRLVALRENVCDDIACGIALSQAAAQNNGVRACKKGANLRLDRARLMLQNGHYSLGQQRLQRNAIFLPRYKLDQTRTRAIGGEPCEIGRAAHTGAAADDGNATEGSLVGIGRAVWQQGKVSSTQQRRVDDRALCVDANVAYDDLACIVSPRIEQKSSLGRCHGRRYGRAHRIRGNRSVVGIDARRNIHRKYGAIGGVDRTDPKVEGGARRLLQPDTEQRVNNDLPPQRRQLGVRHAACCLPQLILTGAFLAHAALVGQAVTERSCISDGNVRQLLQQETSHGKAVTAVISAAAEDQQLAFL